MKPTIDDPGPEILRFERSMPGYPRTSIGLQQFYERESKGREPGEPDPYFLRLCNGKKWWEWTVNEYAALYSTSEWPGWRQLEDDFRTDPRGLEAIARRIKTRVGHLVDDPRLAEPEFSIDDRAT